MTGDNVTCHDESDALLAFFFSVTAVLSQSWFADFPFGEKAVPAKLRDCEPLECKSRLYSYA